MENPLKVNEIHTRSSGGIQTNVKTERCVVEPRLKGDYGVGRQAEISDNIKSRHKKQTVFNLHQNGVPRKLPVLLHKQEIQRNNSQRLYEDNDIEEALKQERFFNRLSPYRKNSQSTSGDYTDSESGLSDEYIHNQNSYQKRNFRSNQKFRSQPITTEPSFRQSERTEYYQSQIPSPVTTLVEDRNTGYSCISVNSNCFTDDKRNAVKQRSSLNRANSKPMSTTARQRMLDNYQSKGVKIDNLYEYTESDSSTDHGSFVIKQYSPSTRSRVSSLTNVSRSSFDSRLTTSPDRSKLTLEVANNNWERKSSGNQSRAPKKLSIDSQPDSVFTSTRKSTSSQPSPGAISGPPRFKSNIPENPPSPSKSSILKVTVTGASEESGIGRSSTSSSWKSVTNKKQSQDSKEKTDSISQSGKETSQSKNDTGNKNGTDTNHNYVDENRLLGVKDADVDSIGSASSVMHRALSRTSRSTVASSGPGFTQTDNDEAILVGDEKVLHDSARRGDIETVESLIKAGIDVNCRNKTDRTVLHWASGNGYVAMLQMLLEKGGLLESADKFGMTPMLWAAWFGHKPCVELLLRAGAKPTVKNKNGSTLLHCATHNNHQMAVELLQEELQEFDREIADDSGRTILHVAVRYNRETILQEFIKLRCSVKTKDKLGNTALHIASRYGWYKLIVMLINAGANIEALNEEGKTPLHVAAECDHEECCLELLKFGADVNAETEDEVCPLHLAVIGGHVGVAHTLIDHHADIDAGNKHNQTPLHHAVAAHNGELVGMLCTCGASVNVQDARSETPLHLAAENGFHTITEKLLIANIRLSLTDQKGKTALDVAARGNYTTIVDMIIKAERHFLWTTSPQDEDGDRSPASRSSGYLPRQLSYKPDISPETENLRHILYKLSHKHLKAQDWKRLAFHWGFTDQQIRAIEEQYTGSKSHREHAHRVLLIWLHGCLLRHENPIKLLFEGLVSIQKRELAEHMRMKMNALPGDKACVIM